ncbi:helix-turn-helix transcriptional regulator [Methylocapsa aurea]|uniref:helix-turn-helix transcriptional regulator n=1 Tax=Methylocapsa aurea TaxID=663610 RepID=UPI003D18A147
MQRIGDIIVLNTAESAALLGVSLSTLFLLRRQDDFPRPIKLNRRNLWLAADLREWAESRIGRNTTRPHTDEAA